MTSAEAHPPWAWMTSSVKPFDTRHQCAPPFREEWAPTSRSLITRQRLRRTVSYDTGRRSAPPATQNSGPSRAMP
eukprot:1123063-Pyramimonas_sp.AAC.1